MLRLTPMHWTCLPSATTWQSFKASHEYCLPYAELCLAYLDSTGLFALFESLREADHPHGGTAVSAMRQTCLPSRQRADARCPVPGILPAVLQHSAALPAVCGRRHQLYYIQMWP